MKKTKNFESVTIYSILFSLSTLFVFLINSGEDLIGVIYVGLIWVYFISFLGKMHRQEIISEDNGILKHKFLLLSYFSSYILSAILYILVFQCSGYDRNPKNNALYGAYCICITLSLLIITILLLKHSYKEATNNIIDKSVKLLFLMFFCFTSLINLNAILTYSNLIYFADKNNCRGLCPRIVIGELDTKKYSPITINNFYDLPKYLKFEEIEENNIKIGNDKYYSEFTKIIMTKESVFTPKEIASTLSHSIESAISEATNDLNNEKIKKILKIDGPLNINKFIHLFLWSYSISDKSNSPQEEAVSIIKAFKNITKNYDSNDWIGLVWVPNTELEQLKALIDVGFSELTKNEYGGHLLIIGGNNLKPD